MKAERNAYTDRYIWTDSIWKEPYGMGNIRGISERDGCCAVNFFSHQPALNYGFYQPDPNEPWQQPMDAPGPQATIEAMKDVMRFWLGMGVDGFRVDMAGSLVKHDPEQKGTIRLWRGIRAFLDREYPDAVLISEWGEPDKSLEGGFHMDFLLHFGPSHYNDLFRCEEPYFCERGKGDAAAFVAKYTENLEKTRGKGLICIPSGNHDMDRLARKLSENALRIAFAFLLSMPGVPFLYYGDEIGMRYVEGPASVEGGYGRTGSRSPMQWDSSTNAGFSAAPTEVLYLPLDADPNRPNVAAQRQNPNSLWHTVHQLIEVRKAHTALQGYGEIQFLYAQPNAYPLVYLRSSGNERILVVINPCGTAQTLELSEVPKETLFAYGGTVTMENGKLRIPACSAGYYLV